jgi:hypothetical protein
MPDENHRDGDHDGRDHRDGVCRAEIHRAGGPGDQAERTQLAWRRTALAATVVTLLVVSRLVFGAPPPRALGAAVIVFAWLVILGVADRRIRSLATVSRGGRAADHGRAASSSADGREAIAASGSRRHVTTSDDDVAPRHHTDRSPATAHPAAAGAAPAILALLTAALAVVGIALVS